MGHDTKHDRASVPRDVATARRWANRLERGPWRLLLSRWVLAATVIVFLALAGLASWWRYAQVVHGGGPLVECHHTDRQVHYEVTWQWLPPGMVCNYADGSTRYVGP